MGSTRPGARLPDPVGAAAVRALEALGRAALAGASARRKLSSGEMDAAELYGRLLREAVGELASPMAACWPKLAEGQPGPELQGLDAALTELRALVPDPAALAELYESLLELHPAVEPAAGTFVLGRTAGHARKAAGSYSTPPELVELVLDVTLEPVLAAAAAARDPEAAVLSLRVCDPACGGGRFLAAAAVRIAARLAAVRTRCRRPDAAAQRQALADAVEACLYGVDVDPTAAALSRLRLVLLAGEGADTGRIGAHVGCADALVGATPALLAAARPGPLPLDDPRAADAWCAALLDARDGARAAGERARDPGFLHWHLAFPGVLRADAAAPGPGWSGGFDVVVGNPPWDKVELLEREWFAPRRPEVAEAPTAAERKRRIAALAATDGALFRRYEQARRRSEALRRFIRRSGRYRHAGAGRANLYVAFVETMRAILAPGGRLGCVVPSGIATDASTAGLLRSLLESGELAALYDFDNRRGLFPGVQGNVRFCVLALDAGGRDRFEAAAQLGTPAELSAPGRRYRLSREDVRVLSPNTGHLPAFSGARDAALILALYRRTGVLHAGGPPERGPWGIRLRQGLFNLTSDSALFRTREELELAGYRPSGAEMVRGREVLVPLLEAKMAQQFDHRAATFEGVPVATRFRTHAAARPPAPAERVDPEWQPLPRYWAAQSEVRARAGDARWFLGFRDVLSAVADARSLIACVVPPWGIANTFPLVQPAGGAAAAAALLALLNSLVADYLVRQRTIGSHLNFYVLRQLAVPPPEALAQPCPWQAGRSLADWLAERALELSFTTPGLADFAAECGYHGAPFAWDERRRFRLRCELDAACLLIYGLARDEAEHVLAAFPVLRRREEREHGRFRTGEAVLAAYDELQRAAAGRAAAFVATVGAIDEEAP
jgi:hypothetical protein